MRCTVKPPVTGHECSRADPKSGGKVMLCLQRHAALLKWPAALWYGYFQRLLVTLPYLPLCVQMCELSLLSSEPFQAGFWCLLTKGKFLLAGLRRDGGRKGGGGGVWFTRVIVQDWWILATLQSLCHAHASSDKHKVIYTNTGVVKGYSCKQDLNNGIYFGTPPLCLPLF